MLTLHIKNKSVTKMYTHKNFLLSLINISYFLKNQNNLLLRVLHHLFVKIKHIIFFSIIFKQVHHQKKTFFTYTDTKIVVVEVVIEFYIFYKVFALNLFFTSPSPQIISFDKNFYNFFIICIREIIL